MDSTQTVPQEIIAMYEAYAALHAPYFISNAEKTIKPRIYKGKGSPEEIQRSLARFKKDTKNISDKEWLQEHHIGIDCSGFVAHLLDAYTTKTYQAHIWSFYKRPTLNPINWIMFKIQPIVSMLNASTLTSKLNTIAINQVKDAKPMDLIRFSGGKHVAMIYSVHRKNDIVDRVEYIHSTNGVGVTKGTVVIQDENKSIVDQEWEKGEDGVMNELGYLIRYRINTNGIKRPIFLTQ